MSMPDSDRPKRRPGQPPGAGGPPGPRPRMSPFLVAAAVVLGLFLFMSFFSGSAADQISLSELEDRAAAEEIRSVTISDTAITGEFTDGTPFVAALSNNFQTQDLVQELQSN